VHDVITFVCHNGNTRMHHNIQYDDIHSSQFADIIIARSMHGVNGSIDKQETRKFHLTARNVVSDR